MSQSRLRSMTGHGAGEASFAGGRVTVELRGLNHRYIDIRQRVASELAEHGSHLEALLRSQVKRGRIEAVARFESIKGEGKAILDEERAKTAYTALRKLRDELDPSAEVPFSLLGSVPHLFQERTVVDSDAIRTALTSATTEALRALDTMRLEEGKALGADLAAHLQVLEASLKLIVERLPQIVADYRTKLKERIERLLEGSNVNLDEGRLEHEVVVFADRSDIAEEITRLRSHIDHARKLLGNPGEGIGKKVDFLFQEMGREANTIGSKSADAQVAQEVVEMRSAIARLREQIQNIL